MKAHNGSPRQRIGIRVAMFAWEVHIASGQCAGLVLCGHIFKPYKSRLVRLETVLVHKERHENAVHVENEIVGVGTVEHVVVEVERHFAVNSVRFAYASDFIYSFFLYHIIVK